MEVQLRPEQEAWATRGRPTEPIPDNVKTVLERTYRTGEVGEVTLTSDQVRTEMATFLTFARRYATQTHRTLQTQPRKIQPTTTQVKFRLIDTPPPREHP